MRGASEYAKYKQKTDEESARIKTAAAVGAYRKQLMGAKTMTEFDALAKQNDSLLQMVVADDDIGAAFWRKNGDKISELTMRDINKLREAKTFEFGKESLRQMLADTQNVLAMEPLGQGNTLLAKGVEEISKTPFLDEAEKATYRNDYLKTGILNLALSDIDEATAAAEKYLPDDEDLRAKIARTGELNVIAKQVAKEAEEEAKYAGDVRSALALWQKKERGEVNAAAYYVLAQNNRADVLWGDDEEAAENPLTEVYRILQNNQAGLKAEDLRDAGNYLIRAYKQGQISFDEAVELQNQLMTVGGGFDEVFADAAERIFGADEGGEFAEKKARKVLEFFEAYNAEKNAKIAEFTANGGVLTPAIARKFARDAVKTASEDYGFAEDAEKWKNDWAAKSAKSENLFDDETAKVYAENEYAGTMSDAETGEDKSSFDDTAFVKHMGKQLIQTEKMKPFVYLDKYGHITAGVGSMLDNEDNFKSINWEVDGRPATKDEIDDAYKIFVSLQKEKDANGKPKYRNYKADFFKKFSELRLSEETMIEAMSKDIAECLRRVKRRKVINFENLPQPMQLIVIDFYYNKGSFFNQKNLPQALIARDKEAFKKAMFRGMPERDNWTLEQFNQIPESFWK